MIFKTLIVMLIMFCLAGVALYDSGITQEEFENVTSKINYDTLNSTSTLRDGGDNKNNTFIERFVYKYADAFLYVFTEGMRSSIKFGYENPQYNFGLIIILLIITFALVPLIYLCLFLYYGITAIGKFVRKRKIKKYGGIK